MKRHALPWIALLNLVLALALAWMWLQRDASLRKVHWTAPPPVTSNYQQMLPSLPARVPVDTGRFLVLLERPLFALNRRPSPPPAPATAVVEAPVDHFSTATVSGMVSGPQTGTVILHIAGKSRRVKLNESVDGWLLKSIQGRTATFVNGTQTRALQLPRAAVNSPQATALPGASAPAASLFPSSDAGAAGVGGDASDANPDAGAAPARPKSRFGP